MNKLKLIFVLAFCMAMLGIGIHHRNDISSAFGLGSANECEVAAACGKCGDRQCQKSCGETPLSCPRDCGVPSAK